VPAEVGHFDTEALVSWDGLQYIYRGYGSGKAYHLLQGSQSGYITINVDTVMLQLFRRMLEMNNWYQEVAALEERFRSIGDFESVGDPRSYSVPRDLHQGAVRVRVIEHPDFVALWSDE
jgi:hypothetical protein